jgi:uncharacterized protein (DUF1015 family)
MTKIAPFRAVMYNPEKIRDLSKVICPPYDIISPQRQQYYHDLDPYNFIHILLGKDIPGEDKYRRSAGYFRDWLKNKIFIQDEKPAIYFYSQQYSLKGEKRTRLGFIALLHLGKSGCSAFAHEHTHVAPKEDRLKLLRQVRANLSPIFVVSPDTKRIIQRTFQREIADSKPVIEIIDEERNLHRLWRLDEPAVIEGLQKGMAGEDIFIADGHHRYEVTCAFRDEMRQKGNCGDEESFDYVLAYFTNTDSHALTILPIHRLLKLKAPIELGVFCESLKSYFEIVEVKDKRRLFFLMEKGGWAEHLLGAYIGKKFLLLRLRNIRILDKILPDKPREYRFLDVTILNNLILKDFLGVDLDDKESLTFNPDADELVDQADKDNSYAAFFLNPVKISQIMAVALAGNKMPPKSTYFYPKVVSGLLINKFT